MTCTCGHHQSCHNESTGKCTDIVFAVTHMLPCPCKEYDWDGEMEYYDELEA